MFIYKSYTFLKEYARIRPQVAEVFRERASLTVHARCSAHRETDPAPINQVRDRILSLDLPRRKRTTEKHTIHERRRVGVRFCNGARPGSTGVFATISGADHNQ